MPDEIIAIVVSDQTGAAVDSDARRFQIARDELLRRLLHWYTHQSDIVRGSVVGTLPSSLVVDAARKILQQLADSGEPPTKPPDEPV